jgi:hypothetical protein
LGHSSFAEAVETIGKIVMTECKVEERLVVLKYTQPLEK